MKFLAAVGKEVKMVIITRTAYNCIIANAIQHVPNEICGLLAGFIDGTTKIVRNVYFLKNVDHSPAHFTMDVAEQFDALKDMRQQHLVMLGNFHSHPATPPRPSEEDKRMAYDSVASYIIVSLASAEPVMKSFHIERGITTEEKLIIRKEKSDD